jgi:16S rRNA pseudouridine516 synthase
MELIPESEREGLFPVGRLDKDTEGLLLLTDDGNFCFRVNMPESKISKTYFFWAKGTVTDEELARLESGVTIYDKGGELTAPAKARVVEVARMRDIVHLLSEDAARVRNTKLGDVPVTAVELTITEGKKHQVKRMARAVGLKVLYLERIAVSEVKLDRTLARGDYRPLTEIEIKTILGE